MKKLSIQKREALKADHRAAGRALMRAGALALVTEGTRKFPAAYRAMLHAFVRSGKIAQRVLDAKLPAGG